MESEVSEMEVSVRQEIEAPLLAKPHVVLLGAGATKAALPDGDNNREQVPLLREVAVALKLANRFPTDLRDLAKSDFEAAYSRLVDRDTTLTAKIDAEVSGYFSRLQLPDAPNLYDVLLLSLRRKDVILTFNWDPFLIQSRVRLMEHGIRDLPDVQFLHGNVLVGYCNRDGVRGLVGNRCRECGQPLSPSRLLFPVEKKNYQDGGMIEVAWSAARRYLEQCFMLTVFGYSAPKTDAEAISLLKAGWGDVAVRSMEETEIINRPEADHDQLRETWKPFIHTHHYQIHESFFESWIANHPRRTHEAFVHQFMEAKFIENNPVPHDATRLHELVGWFQPLLDAEERYYESLKDEPAS